MGVFPVVDRELRVLARRRSLYGSRLASAAMALAVAAFILLITRGVLPGQIGQQMFLTLANFTFVYAAFAGVWMTSDCIAAERRSDTLGLLFLTRLRGVDVVFGKMTASSLQSAYGVLAVFPVMALPLLMGGVGLGEFWRVLLALLVTLLLSLSVGVAISARSRNAVRAGLGSFFVMLLLCVAGPLALVFLRVSGMPLDRGEELTLMVHSPAFGLSMAYESGYSLWARNFWLSMGINLLFAGLALILASRWVQQGWRRSTSAVAGTRGERAGEGRGSGSTSPKGASVGEGNPVCWALSRNRWKPIRVYGVFVILGIYAVCGALLVGKLFFNEANFLFAGFVMQFILKCWVGIEAASRFGSERRSGALELLLCTPMTVSRILQGHWQALLGQFFWPVLGVLCLELALVVAGTNGPMLSSDTRGWAMIYLSGMVFFVLDLVALSWLGLWRGLNARHVSRAIMGTILLVMGLPWLIYFVCTLLISLNSGLFRRAPDAYFLLTLWWILRASSSLYWFVLGRSKLRQELRRVATVPVGMEIPRRGTHE